MPGLAEMAATLERAARLLRRHARAERTWPVDPEQTEPVESASHSAHPEQAESVEARPEQGRGAVRRRTGPSKQAAQIRAIIAARRLRTAYLPDLSGDHAFSMLLELYAAHLEGRRIPQTRLGVAAGVPHATAIRILHALAAEGLVAADTNPADRRLNLLALTKDGAERMHAYLSAASAAAAALV